MNLALLRLPGVLTRKGDSRSSTFVQIDNGTFPPPVKLGSRVSAWPEYEVEAIIAVRIAGWTDDEIRKLVLKLVEFRKVVPGRTTGDIENLLVNLMATIRDAA